MGASLHLVHGLINDAARLVSEGKSKFGWLDLSTLREPYRVEGKKTMGFELAEQLGWEMPDYTNIISLCETMSETGTGSSPFPLPSNILFAEVVNSA